MSSPPDVTWRVTPAFDAVLDAARAGGGWALERLFLDYQPALLRYLRGRCADIADDVASETWLAAARGLRGFSGDADDFRAWLFTIARHRLIDERRRDARRPSTTPLVDADTTAATAPSTETVVADAMAGDEAARRIVALLPSEQADVILLRVVADLSVDQVARIVGKKPSHVRVLQHRGLKRLAEKLVTE
jgi:RNA polymerase sigma-70 factor (ECF subfamily)